MPRALFVHNGSPGRFASIAALLRQRGWDGALLNGPTGRDLEGFPTIRWQAQEDVPGAQPIAAVAQRGLIAGAAAAEAARKLKADGFEPDVIIGHPAWGEMLFLGEVFDAPQIQVGELYYRAHDSDVDFDPEFRVNASPYRVLARNTVLATSYANAARIVCPTPYQASTLPRAFDSQIRVIHEGIDVDKAQRLPQPELRFANGRVLDGSTPVITFINRRFEPMRGFHIMMRALPRLLEQVPEARVLMVGMDENGGYGPAPAEGTWKQHMMKELGARIDMDRVHFVGAVNYEALITIFSISWAHVYMTYPFVLSWSLLDAMACESLIVASDTAPVRDVIRDGENGLLFDFFDHQALADRLIAICRDPARYTGLRKAARKTVLAEYDQKRVCEPAWMNLIEEVARG
ncbi:glycosyltransferase [Sphingomonas sp. ID0503]|uniref:glycosyltransferase n=1 Tax=Sphingomonas sp. ID0503 TaxID=3399691 RepID=UPI003AFB1533